MISNIRFSAQTQRQEAHKIKQTPQAGSDGPGGDDNEESVGLDLPDFADAFYAEAKIDQMEDPEVRKAREAAEKAQREAQRRQEEALRAERLEAERIRRERENRERFRYSRGCGW